MAALRWERVVKRYGDITVIPEFNLDIAQGEFVVLLGPSGCGKSTLLRMLAGLDEVSAGSIRIGDRDVTALAPGQRGLAMVFQQYALYPHMTVQENLSFGLENIGLKRDEIDKRIVSAARMLELDALLTRKPSQLSGGQRQRVAIARAIVKQPAALLFDEPLSNLDAALRGRTRVELAQLHRRLGCTVVFVTHDQVEAMTLADRIVVMNGGRIEQQGKPMDIYRRPSTRFVATFVGNPAMNLCPVARGPDLNGMAQVVLPDGQMLATQIQCHELPQAGLTLGVRPESLRVAPKGAFKGGAEVIERLGERSLVHVRLADSSLVVAECPVDAEPEVGSTVCLQPDLARVCLFDAKGLAHHPA